MIAPPVMQPPETMNVQETELPELIQASGVTCARIYRIWDRGSDLEAPDTEVAIFVTDEDQPMTVRVGSEGQFELLAGW